MESMTTRTNAGYTIIEAVRIDDQLEVVLGKMETSLGAMFVTWQCSGGDNYFWGHYFGNESAAARRDLFSRVLDLLPE